MPALGASGRRVSQVAKSALDTPALLVDLDRMEANIAHIAAACRAHGIAWRPHFKGHKTIEIARKQIEAGAIGITCAKLGEAEILASARIGGILIANQIVGPIKMRRLAALLEKAEVIVSVDSEANVAELAVAAHGTSLRVVIEVNTGMNRAGVEPGAAVVALADVIVRYPALRLVGVMGWEAHTTAIADPVAKEKAVAAAIILLTGSAAACRNAGHDMPIVSCGGTGTLPYCVKQPGITEVQVGGAIFNDEHYRTHFNIDLPYALTILTTVISRPTPTRVILDAGRKAISADAAFPRALDFPGVNHMKLSAEHMTLELDAPGDRPSIGERVEFVVGYGDTTVHLHEEIVALRNGSVEAVWKVAARGKIK
ncbi:MAG TPA: alanine racemase [Rhizomicrobium sp.]|nr:alanine racemase [Rhizomicrobium sp.]